MQHNQRIKAVLLLGGNGVRFGSATPKQFHRMAGKKIYLHTLEQLIDSMLFEEIILVCPSEWKEVVAEDIAVYGNRKLKIAEGGSSRQESSFKGLLACTDSTDIALIHDAVRPFVSLEILNNNVKGAIAHGAVDTCIPSADTLVYAPNGKSIETIPIRSQYLRGQTPQTFSYPLILEAHKKALEEGFADSSDDCSLAIRLNAPVHIVLGEERNIKITSELDLILAEQLFRQGVPTPLVSNGSLQGKRFAITGGTGGIGKAISALLEREGAKAICIARTAPEFSADLTSFAENQEIFERVHRTYGKLDGLINSLGLLKMCELDQLTAKEIDLLIATNLTSVIYACKCAHLKENAHVVNIASSSYVRGKKNYAIYSGAKAAIVNFTQGFAEEKKDLQVNAVVPQRAMTPMRNAHFPDENPETLLTPEEIAEEIIALLKNGSLTGSIIEIRKRY